MDIRDPWRLARDTFGEGVIVGEIGKAAESRAAFALRGLVAVGPGCDIAGKCAQLATSGKIHVDAGAADDEIRRYGAARRLQFDALAGLARGLKRRALVQCEIGMARAAIIGRLRKAFAHVEDAAHEAPAQGIVEIAEMAEEAAKSQPAIGLDQLDLRPTTQQMHLRRASLERGRRIVES